MSKKQDAFYFETLMASAQDALEEARLLRAALTDFDPAHLYDSLQKLHEIEHRADEKKHLITDRLAKAFITPIEREDILLLSQTIDEVTDKLEDVLIRVYINNVKLIRPDALTMLDVVIECCEELCALLGDFEDFRHSKTLKERIIRINALEEKSDKMYVDCMRRLHEEGADALHIIAWREIYDYLEKCADACEHVADGVESAVMKNS
ncbi:MAG TPA: DUF47 family protein [Candidatus Ruthenibacterium merdigallinarum]|nr:DUF47 family protein [Candidatus Ruthenibacterium merdigallinarum]